MFLLAPPAGMMKNEYSYKQRLKKPKILRTCWMVPGFMCTRTHRLRRDAIRQGPFTKARLTRAKTA